MDLSPATTIIEHGDLAHYVLFLWASSTTGLLIWALRELIKANQRFNAFVEAIAKLNSWFEGDG